MVVKKWRNINDMGLSFSLQSYYIQLLKKKKWWGSIIIFWPTLIRMFINEIFFILVDNWWLYFFFLSLSFWCYFCSLNILHQLTWQVILCLGAELFLLSFSLRSSNNNNDNNNSYWLIHNFNTQLWLRVCLRFRFFFFL